MHSRSTYITNNSFVLQVSWTSNIQVSTDYCYNTNYTFTDKMLHRIDANTRWAHMNQGASDREGAHMCNDNSGSGRAHIHAAATTVVGEAATKLQLQHQHWWWEAGGCIYVKWQWWQWKKQQQHQLHGWGSAHTWGGNGSRRNSWRAATAAATLVVGVVRHVYSHGNEGRTRGVHKLIHRSPELVPLSHLDYFGLTQICGNTCAQVPEPMDLQWYKYPWA